MRPRGDLGFVLLGALIALAAYMSGEHRRIGYGRNLIIAGASAVVLRLIGFAVQAAAESDDAMNAVQYLVPLIGIIAAIAMIGRPRRRAPRAETTPSELAEARA